MLTGRFLQILGAGTMSDTQDPPGVATLTGALTFLTAS